MPINKAEKLSSTRAKLTVMLTEADLEPYLKDAYKNISNQVSVPGFRKGHVPAPIIDKRIGKGAVIQEALNNSLDDFFQIALKESGERPLGRPTADVEKWLDPKDPESELVLAFELEVRPEFKMPQYSRYVINVDDADIAEDATETELDKLRENFGELKNVERAAAKDDYVTIDMVASIDGKEVDRAEGVSYKVGAGNMLDGMDEALETLTAGEKTTFKSQLLGGEFEGQDAEIEVTVNVVQERELAAADDEFAKLASEFETIAELREDIAKRVQQRAVFEQGVQARDIFIEKLIDGSKIELSDEFIAESAQEHIANQGVENDAERRAEIKAEVAKQVKMQILFDAIIEQENVRPTQNEISAYIFQAAQQYGIEPGQFIQMVSQNGQLGVISGEVARNKALAIALGKTTVKDKSGNIVDLSEFTRVDEESDDSDSNAGADHDESSAVK
ncbi:trigger factor [Canibacter sp. lx-72]|uniref:trigger factor n=1 Tax=Canibacter zhuwentaonis TaxID=2837491 RepID=UPI001BDD39D7|nr:trigger factor [Canibacter zhuwentaonis]MBT1018474.1 trigger factor [Canibacter zhuwentaonis]